MDEVGRDDFVRGVFEDAFQIRLAGFLHGRADLFVAGFLHSLHREINDRDGRRGHTEGHAGELSFDLGNGQTDGFGRAGGRRNDVDRRGTSALPIFLGRTVDRLLGRGVAVHRGHETLLDAEALFEKDVDDRREAVRCATGVGNDVVLGRVVFVVVHAHDDSDVLFLGGSGDDDFLRTGVEVAFGFGGFGEEAGRFDDDVDTEIYT